LHIAHPIFWVNKEGKHPNPFTIISLGDVEDGIWKASMQGYQDVAVNYVRLLTARGKFPLCIWPPHCIMNGWGSNIYPVLFDALMRWEGENEKLVHYMPKGMAVSTEMYGAFKAEVPSDDTTASDATIQRFFDADEILIAGEALSHCVAETVRQLVGYMSPSKFVLLSDCCSNVTGFEKQGEDFVNELVIKGMRVCKSTEII
jgi:nicotinamidase-related amidase